MHSAQVLISGEVQGVGFRYYVKKNADFLNLNGWVRNTEDGKVEAIFEGSKQMIEEMIEHCRKGPEPSRVDNVAVEWKRPEGLKGFGVKA